MSIAFFRSRRKLIRERKFGEYFSIALGEIILIALGLFLALQFENWNQKRQETKIIESYLVKICDELKVDIQSLELTMEKREQDLIYTNTILKYYINNHIEDSKLFLEGYNSVFVESRFFPNTRAFESLKNSGYMKDLENPVIEEQLNQYYHLVDNLIFVENKFNSVTQTTENILVEKGFYAEYQDIFVQNNTDAKHFTIESMQKYPEYHSTFIVAKAFLEELMEDYADLLTKARETIEIIESGD